MRFNTHFLSYLCVASAISANPGDSTKCPTPEPVAVEAWTPLKAMETEYYLVGYRDPKRPLIRHEGHKVYRRTMVPEQVGHNEVSSTRVPTAAHAPLPVSVEIATELAAQRGLTEEVQALQRSMVETEKAMREQYAELLRQTASVQKLREELEIERNRLRQAQTSENARESTTDISPKATAAPW